MIRKVYDGDALPCPECGAQMRVIALIEDPAVIERILASASRAREISSLLSGK
jgi:hypothetical protein